MNFMKTTRAGAVVLLAGLALSACKGSEAEVATTTAPEVATIARANLDIRAEASGLIEPLRFVEVKSKASGEVMRVHVESGDNVTRGQLLVEIDPRDVQNAYDQAAADLEVAKARLQTAEAQRKRTQELRKANVVTEQELETASMEEANARAQMVKAQVNLDLSRERLRDVQIRAPIDGTVVSESLEVGQIIASASQNISGGTTLLLMADLAEMQVHTLVDETDIGRIHPGQGARVTVEAFPDRTFNGTVFKIEPQAVVEQNVTMFPVLVRLDNRSGLLKPGMNADVAVEIAQKENVVVVPNAAVVSMRDAVAAGAVVGLDEEAVRVALRGGDGGGENGGAQNAGGQNAQRPADATPNVEQPTAKAATGSVTKEQCTALQTKMREARESGQQTTDADRASLRSCMEAGHVQRPAGGRGGMGGGGMGGMGGGNRNPDVRPAVVFVAGANGAELRRVMLGLNDWDNTEVISGLQEGEKVIIMSVARLQAQQQQFQDQMRQRASNQMFGGGAGGPGGGGRGGR